MSSSLNHEGTTEAPAFKYEYHTEDEEDNSAQSGERLNSDDGSSGSNSPAKHLQFHRKKLKLRQRRNPVSKFVRPSYDSDLEDGQSTSGGDDSSSESELPDDSSSTSKSTRSETQSSSRDRLRLGHAGAGVNILTKQKPRLVPFAKYVLSKMARFSGKYHKELGLIFFLIASTFSLVKKG
jgi:hypothetical protein